MQNPRFRQDAGSGRPNILILVFPGAFQMHPGFPLQMRGASDQAAPLPFRCSGNGTIQSVPRFQVLLRTPVLILSATCGAEPPPVPELLYKISLIFPGYSTGTAYGEVLLLSLV